MRHWKGLLAGIAGIMVAGSAHAYTANTSINTSIYQQGIREAAPAVTQSTSGGTTGSTAPGTSSAPVRSFTKAVGKGHSFGNANFGASYHAGVSFFGGRTAHLEPVINCKPEYASSANDYDTGDPEDCYAPAMEAAARLADACADTGMPGIEHCMTNTAFRQANYSDVQKVRLEMEQRILETEGHLRADAKIVGIDVSLIDIQARGRSSMSQTPAASLHYFVRGQDVYDATPGQGTRTYDKSIQQKLWEASKTFMVGGAIPVTLKAQVWGEVGITFSSTAYASSTAVGVTPHGRLWTVGSVTVDAGLYAGGVQATLELLDVQAPATASLARYPQQTADKLTWAMNVDVILSSLDGKVELFGKPLWRTYYDYKTLIEWAGWTQTFNLYHQQGDAFVYLPI